MPTVPVQRLGLIPETRVFSDGEFLVSGKIKKLQRKLLFEKHFLPYVTSIVQRKPSSNQRSPRLIKNYLWNTQILLNQNGRNSSHVINKFWEHAFT